MSAGRPGRGYRTMQHPVRPPSQGRGQKGQTLIEVLIAVALIAIIMPAIFTALSAALGSADRVRDRSLVLELVQSQMESIQGQEYRSDGNYRLVSTPPGYAIAVKATPAASYQYPDGSPTEETIQQITITVTGRHSSLTLEGYKVKR
ncbi:MAG: hypothetical protein DDT27_01193 [Dehalococcoidia bacterium]|nr:hypothetical protein [Chloroflexota bacterium]